MTERLDNEMRSAAADGMTDLFSASAGTLKIYTGTQPTSANDAPSGSLLVTITLPTPAFGGASNGVASKSGTWSDNAGADGEGGWFRLADNGDTARIDGSVTDTGSGGDLQLDDATIVNGGTVTISTFTITVPAE